MPLLLDTTRSDAPAEFRAANCITIGLINNMPDPALEATERQFMDVIRTAATKVVVRLLLFSIPEVPRAATTRQELADRYHEDLLAHRLEALCDPTWGIHEIRWDARALGAGQASLKKLAAILPDGTPIACGDGPDGAATRSLPIRDLGKKNTLEVYVGIRRQHTSGAAGEIDKSARYVRSARSSLSRVKATRARSNRLSGCDGYISTARRSSPKASSRRWACTRAWASRRCTVARSLDR